MKRIIGSIAISAALGATAAQAEDFGGLGISVYSGKSGISVAEVLPNSPAAKTGLQAGDVIVSVNGTLLSSIAPENQISALRGSEGSSVALLVQRDGKNITLSAKRAGISVQNIESGDLSAWFGKSEGLTPEEISYLASQKVGEGYELLGVTQNGYLISGAGNLNAQPMQQISIKAKAEAENNPAPAPQTGSLNSANREAISFSLSSAVSSAKVSVLNVKGAVVWQMDLGKLPAGSSEVRWNGASLPAGSYHVKLETGSAVSSGKFDLR